MSIKNKLPKNGWTIVNRKDPNIDQLRPMKILMKDGKEVEHHWLDKIKKPEQTFEYWEDIYPTIFSYARYNDDMHVVRDSGDLFEMYEEPYEKTIERLKAKGYKIDTIKDKISVLDKNERIFASFDSPLIKVIEKSISDNKV